MRWLLIVLVNFYFCSELICDEKIDLEKAVKDLGSDQYETRLKAKKILESVGIRAIPHLKKAINSNDMDTREFAEKKIAEFYKFDNDQANVRSHFNSDVEPTSTHKFINEYYVWLKEFLLLSYEKNSTKNPKWDTSIKKFIFMWLEYYKGIELEGENNDMYQSGTVYRKNEMELRKQINEITALGCEDAIFLFLKNSLYYVWFDYRYNIELVSKTSTALSKSDYSNYFIFFTELRAKVLKTKMAGGNKNETKKILLNVFNKWIEMGKEDAFKSRIGQRRYMQWSTTFWEELSIEDIESNLEKFSANVGKDKWADHTFKAQYFVKKAWYHRGNGDKEAVTEEGEKLFQSNLLEAEKHAVAAYQVMPEYTEPLVLLITIAMGTSRKDKCRAWFEKSIKVEINNTKAFNAYIESLRPKWGGSTGAMIALGRDYLMINNPKFNTAKFYMTAIRKVLMEKVDVLNLPGVLNELEWAVEQQVSFKSIFAPMFYNDIVPAAIRVNDFQKGLKAIQDSKGLFCAHWFRLTGSYGDQIRYNSTFEERLILIVEKYKNTATGIAIIKALKSNREEIGENIKTILDNMDKDIEALDLPKVVNIIVSMNGFNFFLAPGREEVLLDIQKRFGYREAGLIAYMRSGKDSVSEKLKLKLVELYGFKTMEAIDLIIKADSSQPNFQKDLVAKIKLIFMKGITDENKLEKDDDYNKAQIRSIIYWQKGNIGQQEIVGIITPYVKNLQNRGDACDFLIANCISRGNSGPIFEIAETNSKVSFGLAQALQETIWSHPDHTLEMIDEEIKRLSSIKDNHELMIEVNKTWVKKGNPEMMIELVNLLNQRKLPLEADSLKTWMFYTMEGYYSSIYFDAISSEVLLAVLSCYPGYDKEAYQMGLNIMRTNSCNTSNYLMAYHIFKLGHFQLAYDYICKGQTLKEHGAQLVFNKKAYTNSDELLKSIVNEILASKELPEHIRFNLKDQFDAKFRK